MEKLVLHEAGEGTELRDVAAEEIDLVHHAQHAADLAFAREHRCEDFARRFRVSERSRHETQAAADEIFELGAEIEMMFLRELEGAHQQLRLVLEDVVVLRMELPAATNEFAEIRLVRLWRAEGSGRANARRSLRGTGCELLGDALGHAEDVARVLVVIAHQRFAAELRRAMRIVQPFRDLLLEVQMQHIGRAAAGVVQVGAHAQQEIVGRFDAALVGFAQPVFADELIGRQRAFLEERDPEQVLVIAQSAAAALHVRLLHVNAVAVLRVARGLVVHPQRDVLALETTDALRAEAIAKEARDAVSPAR